MDKGKQIASLGGSLFMVGLAIFFLAPVILLIIAFTASSGNGTQIMYLLIWIVLMSISIHRWNKHK